MKICPNRRLGPNVQSAQGASELRASAQVDLAKLHQLLTKHFDSDELKSLCLYLDVDYDILPGEGKAAKARELIVFLERRSRTSDLVRIGLEQRPDVLWDDALTANRATPDGPPKRCSLSKPVVWIVIVALILLGVCLVICRPQRRPVVTIKTAHNRYVTAMDDKWHEDHKWDWVLKAETYEIRDWEEFTLLCLGNGKIALQTWHETEEGQNRYVTAMGADKDWGLYGETDKKLEYEEFTPVDADTQKRLSCSEVVKSLEDDGEAWIAFQTWHKKEGKNRFVTAMDAEWDWVLRAETNELLPSEKFTVELLRLERRFNMAAYATAIGGSLFILSIFVFIYWRKLTI